MTQVGDVASVQIVWDRTSVPSDVWIDFHNLIKIDGIWKITNKTCSAPRSSWGVVPKRGSASAAVYGAFAALSQARGAMRSRSAETRAWIDMLHMLQPAVVLWA